MKLWLVRHGDARQGKTGERDFDRDLSERGAADAERFGAWLAHQPDRPHLIISSDAARTRATASWIVRCAGPDAGMLHLDRRMYDASARTLLDIVRETPAEVRSLAVVGHNPGMSELAQLLPADNAPPALPTLGVVLMETTVDWHDLASGMASVLSFSHPGAALW